ncbi:MAG: TVP38/TMEM64 family protein, partial [Dialister sp.]|nr:TVP38/TMEM64 family protein [Dialister sp.]
VTAVGALSNMSFYHYALGCLIGKFPSVALEVILGHDVVNFGDNSLRLTIIIIAVAVSYGGIWWYTKREKK